MEMANFQSIVDAAPEKIRFLATTSGKSWNLHSAPGIVARYIMSYDAGTGLVRFEHRDVAGPEIPATVEYTEVSQIEIVSMFP